MLESVIALLVLNKQMKAEAAPRLRIAASS